MVWLVSGEEEGMEFWVWPQNPSEMLVLQTPADWMMNMSGKLITSEEFFLLGCNTV
jgi:hypothetical protein